VEGERRRGAGRGEGGRMGEDWEVGGGKREHDEEVKRAQGRYVGYGNKGCC
jgi:hypothetical protein